MASTQQIQDALALSALADNPNANVTLSSGWNLSPSTVASYSDYGSHGLDYTVYVNPTTKVIAIAFGANINSNAPNASSSTLVSATLQIPGVSPSVLPIMNDAAALVTSVFASTQPGYTGEPIEYDNGVPIGPGYKLFVTGAGIGGTAAEYSMESVLTSYPNAQTNGLISGISFGGSGLSNSSSFQGADFTSYVNYSDLFSILPPLEYHVGATVQLAPTPRDYINDVVVAALAETGLGEAASIVVPMATEAYIKGETVYDYARALIQQGIIQSNPLNGTAPSSPTFNFDLQDVFPNLIDYAQNLVPSSTVAELQTGAIVADGVTQDIAFSKFSNGTSSLVVSEGPSGIQATETLSFDASGNPLQNQIEIDGATITTSGSESAALSSDVDGSLIVIFSPTDTALGDFELVANQDGTSELIGVNSATGDEQEIAEFASGGITGDMVNVSQASSGIVDVTTDIGTSDTSVIAADSSVDGISQDFMFTGTGETLEIDSADSFAGTISGFVTGDTIDLTGIGTAIGATLGGGNVLLVQAGSGNVALNLDPAQDFSGDNFVVTPDGSGGTDIMLNLPPVTTAPGPQTVTAGVTTPIAGISVADADAISANETLSVVLSDGNGMLTAQAADGGTVSGSGSTSLTASGSLAAINAELATVSYTGAAATDGSVGTDTIDVATSDGRGGSDEHKIGITVDPSNGEVVPVGDPTAPPVEVGSGGNNTIIDPGEELAPASNEVPLPQLPYGTLTVNFTQPGDQYIYQPQILTSPSDDSPHINAETWTIEFLPNGLPLGDPATSPYVSFQVEDVDGAGNFTIGNSDGYGGECTLTCTVFTSQLAGSVTSFLADQSVLSTIGSFVISDTAANVAANFDALEADAGNIQWISFSDTGVPTLDLTQTQAINDASALAKIVGSYDLVVTDPGVYEANEFTVAQVAVSVNAGGSVDFVLPSETENLGAITTIDLADATITVGGDVVTQDNNDGSKVVSTFNIVGQDYASTVATYNAASQLVSEIFYGADGSVYFSYTGPVLVASFLADQVLNNISGGVAITDTTTAIQANLAILEDDAANIASITATGGTLTESIAVFTADQAALDKITGGFDVSDTAANIENGLADLTAATSNIDQITSTDVPVSATAATFLTYQSVLDLVTGGVVISDTAANVETNFDALDTDAANIQSITFTDTGTPVLQLTEAQVTADAALFAKIQGSYYIYVYDANGTLADKEFVSAASGQPYSSYRYVYSPGNDFIGSDFFYTGITRQAYTGEEVDYDGGGNLARVAFMGDSVDPFSAYEYDYVGGVFSGSQFTYTSVPTGASYSSYEVDYDRNNTFIGDKFFFTDLPGQSYTGEEMDFDASGNLARVLLTGVTEQTYSSLELDYNAGSYTGYKAYYDITGQSFTSEEVDVSAADAITKVVYSGLSGTPYSSVEEDYGNGALTGVIYDFTNVSGASVYAYQVTESASGVAQQETFDNNDGSHTIIGLANNQTLTSLGNDMMTGGGPGATFVFAPVYGHDTITDFSTYATGANPDTISLPSSEFANFAAVLAGASNSGNNTVITAADGDTLTLNNLSTATLAGLGGDFTFHA